MIRPETMETATGPVKCHERLGRLLKYYYREGQSQARATDAVTVVSAMAPRHQTGAQKLADRTPIVLQLSTY